MNDDPHDKEGGDDNLVPSLPEDLDPEEALRGFMRVDPEKVKERLEERDEQDGDE